MKLFNDGWKFSRQPLHTTLKELNKKGEIFEEIGLPHDWLIYDTDNLYQNGTGWYKKTLEWKKQIDELVILRFDGIYMDSCIYVNGEKAGEWKYGYSAFEVDITKYIKDGMNEINISVDFQSPNSRWYSGAGIYRNVWLKTVHTKHILSDGIYFHAKESDSDCWEADIETEVYGQGVTLEYELSKKGGEWSRLLGEVSCKRAVDKDNVFKHRINTKIVNPKIWSVEEPCCYRLRVTLKEEEKVLQVEEQTVGFRTLDFIPKQGFLLNGKSLKLNGVCEHHDLGCLGAAYHTKAMKRKFNILKQMGVNAVRLTHNMPAADVMDLADEMGILIVSEAFDMWESSKTEYDYGRFFKEWYDKDIESWVRRDRNHPSLIMWSIGNEIYDTHISEKGYEWTKILMDEVNKYDPKQNARVTIGSNYMPWENARKCADVIKLAGYNYGEKYYDEHHEKYPDWIIYGSETASTVQSRGIYHFPYQQSVLADEDEQCSSLGNSTTSWGAKSSEACIIAERDHKYSCGQFLWTGFDYIGEPTPYHTRNSYFGQIDTAGFLKDSYFIYQAEWTDYKKNPMVHIFPYWDFNEGQLIDIRVCTNAPVVELIFNGKSQGTYTIDHEYGTKLLGHWQLPYAKGELKALACDENGRVVAQDIKHSFEEAAKICLNPDVMQLDADGQDLLFLEIYMEDVNGYRVENANNRVHIKVEGAGKLVGMDSGDSTEEDGYKVYSRRLFSGKLLAVFKAEQTLGDMKIMVTSQGLQKAELTIPVVKSHIENGSSALSYLVGEDTRKLQEDIPVRNILLKSKNGLHLHEKNLDTEVTAQLCPENAYDREVIWSIVDDSGISSTLAEIEPDGLSVRVKAKSDGQLRLRCMSKCQTGKVRIISQLEFMITGLGKAYLNPYAFISAGLYSYSKGEIGNEHGVATARDGESQVGFYEIDFGVYGSDEITIPIFALSDEEYEIKIYEGMPEDKNSELIADVIYKKPSKWNVYQEAAYRLNKRLKGITSICFVLEKKVHIKGFIFTKQSQAWEKICVSECNKIYGDSFQKEEEWIRHIGNNVTIEFEEMEFGEAGVESITICGSTPLEKNTIIMCFVTDKGEERRMIEFSKVKSEQTFTFEPVLGSTSVSFIFLPGSNFDFHWFRFKKSE